jgi:hypothetical protein
MTNNLPGYDDWLVADYNELESCPCGNSECEGCDEEPERDDD